MTNNKRAMFTTNNSSNNRLLALEEELLAWKRSPKHHHQQIEQNDGWLSNVEEETEAVDEWDTDTVEAEESRSTNPETIAEQQQEPQEYSRENQVWQPEPKPFSYAVLADRLNHPTHQPFRRNTRQLQAQRDELEPLPQLTLFASPLSQVSPPPPVIAADYEAPTTLPLPSFSEVELPMREPSAPLSFDVSLLEAEEDIFPSASSSAFSGEEPSYTSLMQMIQTARHSGTTSATIDVEAQAIAPEEPQEEP